jgi:hypothetical protein
MHMDKIYNSDDRRSSFELLSMELDLQIYMELSYRGQLSSRDPSSSRD